MRHLELPPDGRSARSLGPRPGRALAILFALVTVAPLGALRSNAQPQPLACPTGTTIPNWSTFLTSCGNRTSYDMTWDAPAGADGTTQYEIRRSTATFSDYCAVPGTTSFTLVGTTSARSFTYVHPRQNEVFLFQLAVKGCNTQSNVQYIVDTFSSPPAPAVLTATAAGSSAVSVTFRQPDARAFAVRRLLRSFNGGAFAPVAGFSSSTFPGFQGYCPANSTKTYLDNGLAPGTYAYQLESSGNAATCYAAVLSSVVAVTVGSSCAVPGIPQLSAASSVVSGHPLAVSWSAASGLLPGGFYVVETSRDGFVTIESSITTGSTSAVLSTNPSASDGLISVRVHAVQACGSSGSSSNVVGVTLKAAPANFVVTQAGPSWMVVRNALPPSAAVLVKNVGAVAGRISFATTGGFFSINPAFLDLAPGASGTVILTASSEAVKTAGLYSGTLVGTFSGGSLITNVSLSVAAAAAGADTKVRSSVSAVEFNAPAGTTPAGQTISFKVTPNTGSVTLSPSIGPGGSWLKLSGELSRPVPASGEVFVTLSVDRSLRSPQEVGPIYQGTLVISAVGAPDMSGAAFVTVTDTDTLTVVSASGERGSGTSPGAEKSALAATPPGGSSFILATAVKATSGVTPGQVFTSDAWLRNLSGAPANADVFCTVDGRNGLTQAVKTTVNVPAGGTFRLADLMQNVFKANGVSANIEVRTENPGAFSFRSATESTTAGDSTSKFGTEIPMVAYNTGSKLGDPEVVIPNIDDDAANRANLILAETAGSTATVKVNVYGPTGNVLGTVSKDVPPWSKVQINRVVDEIAHQTLSGGSLGVSVTVGAGRVVAVATVIDNKSGSFYGVVGRLPRALLPSVQRPPGLAPLAAADRYLMPAVARLRGAFDTQFITNMSIVNGTGATANLTMTYQFIDTADGNKVKTSTKTLSIPPRGSMPKAVGSDVISAFFGVTNPSFGSIMMSGDVSRIVGVAAVSAQVDPLDASKGIKSAQVNGTPLDAPAIAAAGQGERRFAGMEKSLQKRSNMVLLEVDGQPCKVLMRINAATGETLAQATYDLGASEYKQITDVFGDQGVNLGAGPFQNAEVTAQVISGTGRILALASVIDNVSRNPEIFVLTQPGPPPDPSIGF